jgi:hypothetical protein
MNRIRHIVFLTAVLLGALAAVSCEREKLYDQAPQLMVSLYIPGSTMTRAETRSVSPLDAERRITSLQIWAFLSEDGTLISYRSFDSGLDQSGLPGATITRFGLPLSEEMFALLSSDAHPRVDVYAVANAASAMTNLPSEITSRDALDERIVNKIGGSWPLTTAVPDAGLPMSGVLKGAIVSGGYPVLNISTLKLTRAVSKIRFVFCQQGTPASEDTPAAGTNPNCQIIGIAFDGTNNGKDCQIAVSEKLFTTLPFDLGDDPAYIPLTASVGFVSGTPLISNQQLSVVDDPERLFFRGLGNESETAENYEARLDAAIGPESQVGPIYLRETDKTLSGYITYRTAADGEDRVARFSMEPGDVFSRNHTWVIYACFMEETMSLKLRVEELPWEWTGYSLDYTVGSVNVIRRFTVFETPTPTFKKVQTEDGFYDVTFWHTVQLDEHTQENMLEGDIIIATPVGGTLHVIPVPGTNGNHLISDAITVSPAEATIYPNYQSPDNPNGRIEHCRIPIQIRCNTGAGYTDEQLEGNYVDLHFSVETLDGRFVDLGSESIDYYRFILSSSWNQ